MSSGASTNRETKGDDMAEGPDTPLTPTERDGLEYIGYPREDLCGWFTSRRFRKRTAESLERKGLVKAVWAQQADPDGFPRENCQDRLAWFLTEKGIAALDAQREAAHDTDGDSRPQAPASQKEADHE